MAKDYKNYLDIHTHYEGNDRRYELMSDILENGTFLPKTIEYKDIDEDFKRWVEEELVITSNDGKEFPTMVLYSNQRFSEYNQSWKFTDKDKNLLLNFKTVTRTNNPTYGKIQSGLFNIPGENRFYTMKKQIVLDDNGSESFLVLKMRQPTAIDLTYTVSIFATAFQSLNEFNTMINKKFRSCQCYIRPNNHYMPMTLESIDDTSSYNIDDRQYYAQSFNIKVMAYIITKDDYRVEEVPLKRGLNLYQMQEKINLPEAEIEECEKDDTLKINICFPEKCIKQIIHFTCDTDFMVEKIEFNNIYNGYKIFVNGELNKNLVGQIIHDGDEIKIAVTKVEKQKEANIMIKGLKNA